MLKETLPEPSFCFMCYGDHIPDTKETWVVWGDRQYTPPFYCTCCAEQICSQQFGFGKMCGICDTGHCACKDKSQFLPKMRSWAQDALSKPDPTQPKYTLIAGEGMEYGADSLFELAWDVFKHRLFHLFKGDGWVD